MGTVFRTATALLLLFTVTDAAKPPPRPPPPAVRVKNGVRLVGGSGSKGRLEIASKDSWVVGYGSNATVGWSPVCDNYGSGFSDSDAEVMCKLLGYSYGRKYYAPAVTYRKSYTSGTRKSPVGFLSCASKASGGRHLHRRVLGSDAAAATADPREGGNVLPMAEEAKAGRKSRSLALRRGTVNTPKAAPYKCSFMNGLCDYTGPLAGVECSHTPMPPAPSPPPSPPLPPAIYDRKADYIRVFGDDAYNANPVEPNLCAADDFSCAYYGRFEILVNVTAKKSGWVPLCFSDKVDVGTLVCKQVSNWVDQVPQFGFMRGTVDGRLFHIPSEPVTAAGDFNPANYKYWATVVGGDPSKVQMVQELHVKLSSTPCSSGLLLAVDCTVWQY